ncbi:MAG: hypothetical protein ABEK59_05065 [Halobacteria archaeon]
MVSPQDKEDGDKEDGSGVLGRRRFLAGVGSVSPLFLDRVYRQIGGTTTLPVNKLNLNIVGRQSVNMHNIYYLNGVRIDGLDLDTYRTRSSGWKKVGRGENLVKAGTSDEVTLEGRPSDTFSLLGLGKGTPVNIYDVFQDTRAKSYEFYIYRNVQRFNGEVTLSWTNKGIDVPLFGIRMMQGERRVPHLVSRLGGRVRKVNLRHPIKTGNWYRFRFEEIDYQNGSGRLVMEKVDAGQILTYPFSFDPYP